MSLSRHFSCVSVSGMLLRAMLTVVRCSGSLYFSSKFCVDLDATGRSRVPIMTTWSNEHVSDCIRLISVCLL